MIRFGPSGNSARFYDEGHTASTDAPKWLADQGLNAYEYSFGRGVNISSEKAAAIGELSKAFDVEISVHAPYYINLANPSDDMAAKSYGYILKSCERVRDFGGKRVIFHPASVGKVTRNEAVALAQRRMEILASIIKENGMDDCIFCPETMGKINQIGDVAEVTEFCKVADFFIPTIDFGHINARTYGSLKTEDDFDRLLTHVIDNLGMERASKMHVHFSNIEDSAGGEVKHLTFADEKDGPEFLPLAKALVKRKLEPVIICESDGTQADDACEMKRIYESLL